MLADLLDLSHREIPLVVSIILLVCLVLFYKLRITIEDETLCASFGPGIIRKRVRLAEIVGCEPIRIRWWYGWGIHLTPFGWLYNVSGFDAVAITLRDGRKFALGTDDPHGAHRRIRGQSGNASRANFLAVRVPRSVFQRVAEPLQSSTCSWRNQRSAMEVCASLTSWPPWKVPIRIR